MVYAGIPAAERRHRAANALSRVGLGERLYHRPNQLAGGEQQRVAMARAMVMTPRLILADEPTGNLDSRTSKEVMALFQELNRGGITIILVTHEPDIAAYAGREIVLKDGQIVSDSFGPSRYAQVLHAEAPEAGNPPSSLSTHFHSPSTPPSPLTSVHFSLPSPPPLV